MSYKMTLIACIEFELQKRVFEDALASVAALTFSANIPVKENSLMRFVEPAFVYVDLAL